MAELAVVILSSAIFVAIILYLAVNQDNRERWVGMTFFIASVGGLCIYGASYANGAPSIMVAIFRTVVDVGRMFAGVNNVAVFQAVVGEKSPWLIIFWVVHFLAYYSMASAIIMAVAKTTLKRIRGWFLRINDVDLIYGINDNSIAYGTNLSGKKKTSIVYVGSDNGGREPEVRQLGGLMYADADAMNATDGFLKRLSVKKGKTKIRLSALSNNTDANFEYAVKMLKTLEKAGIKPEQTEIVLLGREEQNGAQLQALGDKYGYGTVKVFDKPELIARLLMQEYPICNAITFDENAKATCDADILLVGFGRKGQEVLKKLVSSGQFEGSHFRVNVFDAGGKSIDGFFAAKYAELLSNYDITFQPYDGRSRYFTQFLSENLKSLKYIVVAVGDERVGREIAINILDYMVEHRIKLPVYQCCSDSVLRYSSDSFTEQHDIYNTDILYGGELDGLAQRLNHFYCKSDESVQKTWAACNYFNRMSSRASADFLSTYLKRLDLVNKSEIPAEMMENLAKTEHLRWCAFHYSMGYRKMDEDTMYDRARRYKEDKSVRITKDAENRLHACLIPWNDLDILSAYENEVTGKNLDYKQMDRDNVKVIFDLMKE